MRFKGFDRKCLLYLQTTVCSVTQCPDFSESGRWDVVTETEGKQYRAVFDAVLVCTGHFLNPHLPLESFPGESFLPETLSTLSGASGREFIDSQLETSP